MKRILWLFLLLPVTLPAQTKKQKRKMAAEKAAADQVLQQNLQNHVQYLADDKLEGRRTGTAGEKLAVDYIIKTYQQIGLEPKGNDGFIQSFEINEGKQIDANSKLVINQQALTVNKEYFPLAFSANGQAAAKLAVAMNEQKQPWFKDVHDWLEENKNNPHFDIEAAIKKEATRAATKGATALLLYNSTKTTDNILFNKNDTSSLSGIPVIYISHDAQKKYFADHEAMIDISLQVAISLKKRTAHNVIGFIDNKAANTIILGAHFDHLGYGEDNNQTDPQAGHIIHNGADDNASGTAAVIELARLLKKKNGNQNNYLFINFSGEELGLYGSKYWLEHPTVNITPNYMINMDMVGRYDSSRKLTIGGYGTSPIWGNLFTTISTNNLQIKFDSSGSGPSDHASFYRKNIPVLFFFTGSHTDYHKATDDWDKVNYAGQKDIVNLIYTIIESSNDKGKFGFTKTNDPVMSRSTRFTVSLGVVPDYGFTGTGMRIDGVSPGKVGEKIGLRQGDILLQLGEYKFADVQSYMSVLGKFNKGDKTKLRIKRGSEELNFDIEF